MPWTRLRVELLFKTAVVLNTTFELSISNKGVY